MYLFQVIKDVLDELYDQLPFTSDNEKDEAIFCKLKMLRGKYAEITKGVTINYSDSTTRFAYIYRYVATHAFATYALLRGTPELGSLFDTDRINVCSIGGGPGSDLLGILKYVGTNKKPSAVSCRVYDREERWRESLSSVCNRLTSFSLLPTFRTLNVIDIETWNKYPELLESNLFTMSYFVSELYSRRGQAEDFFMNLFKNSKKPSWFLFVDNSSGYSRQWFDELVKIHNQSEKYDRLHLIRKSENHKFLLEDSEQAKDLEPYYSKFRIPGQGKFDEVELPKSCPTVDYRIYRKV